MPIPENIFNIQNESDFQKLALEIFRYQAENVPVYKNFISHLKVKPEEITDYRKIPFLPVELFKSHEIIIANKKAEVIFESSSTTGAIPSRHFVADISMYEESFLRGFRKFYGEPAGLCILALLPSYLERTGSSLVYMAEKLIRFSANPDSGFYLNEQEKLISVLRKLKRAEQPTLLLGVSFALLELSEKYEEDLNGIIVMETGGMKGRRKELVREELHTTLQKSFNLNQVHSEYGMTELLSQAYSGGQGIFRCPSWMKILIRDSYDPFQILESGNTGSINIIDLANIYSCSFIATSDLGRLENDGSFEVLGRIDNSDIRGCNLMIG
jgi:phenylacetate-coenzyme A ligase PaaK-like adenylate-forming protein